MGMTNTEALTLAKTAGRGTNARVALANSILGNARKAMALRAAILRNASAEHRALVERFFPNPANDSAATWDLLCDIASRSAVAEAGF